MKVLLDSNIYKRNLTLEGSEYRLLFSQAAQGTFELVLPEVVARETTDLYRRRVDEKLKQLKNAASDLAGLQVSITGSDEVDIEQAAADFRQRLESKVLGPSQGTPLEIPDIPHDELVNKAVRKQRPFGGKATGYRDALIWRNALELTVAGETVALVTNNHKDFADGDGGDLHPDLVTELEAVGSSVDSVLLYHDLNSFLKAQIPVQEAQLQQVRDLLSGNEGVARLEDDLATAVEMTELPNEGRAFFRAFDIYAEGAWIESLDHLESIEVDGAYGLDEGHVAVELTAKATVTIDFLAHKGDLYSTERMHDLGDEVDPPIRIYDYDYNDSMAGANAQMQLVLTVQARFNLQSAELEDVEVTEIQPLRDGA